MNPSDPRESSRGWKRFFVHVDAANVAQVTERRTMRSMAWFILWVVGGLVGLSLIVWHVLSAAYPAGR